MNEIEWQRRWSEEGFLTRNLYEYFNDNCSDHHLSSHILATSFIMVKRKETVDPATPAAPAVKKPRISSAAGTRANPATTPKPLVGNQSSYYDSSTPINYEESIL